MRSDITSVDKQRPPEGPGPQWKAGKAGRTLQGPHQKILCGAAFASGGLQPAEGRGKNPRMTTEPPIAGYRRIASFALRYWAAVFSIGFVLGTVRTLWLAPATGELAAVAIELPVMLAASWLVAGRLLRARPLAGLAAAAIAGLLALALLLASELALAVMLAGETPLRWLEALGQPPGALGLAGQVLFALIPAALVLRQRGRR
jgi:hypothetical protein